MLAIASLVLLSAAPLKIAVPVLRGVGVSDERKAFLSEHFAQAVRRAGVTVVTERDIAAVLGLERQRQLLGCNEGSSCMAELASALGADAIAIGDVAVVSGTTYQVNLKAIDASTSRVVASRSGRVDSESGLLDALDLAGQDLARDAWAALRPKLPPLAEVQVAKRYPLRKVSWVPAVIALAGGALGAVGMVQANSAYGALVGAGSPLSMMEATDLAGSGRQSQTLGWIGLSIGVAGLAVAAVLFLLSDEPVRLR